MVRIAHCNWLESLSIMIIDIPSSEDFLANGIDYLNMAWEMAINVGLDADTEKLNHPHGQEDCIKDESDNWDAVKLKYARLNDRAFASVVRRELGNSVSLLHQGIEFVLMARISQVSPYLLIASSPREWPKPTPGNDTPFADFRTVDSQDLIRIYNLTSREHLSDNFVTMFNKLRLFRNRIIHSIDRRAEFSSIYVIEQILEVSYDLFGERQWTDLRRNFLERIPNSEFSRNHLVYELNCVYKHLNPSLCFKHFGFRKNKRRFFCHVCNNEMDSDWCVEEDMGLAQLIDEQADMIYCTACNAKHEVKRIGCPDKECPSDVFGEICPGEFMCLVCTKSFFAEELDMSI
jgi:hypothetical protein